VLSRLFKKLDILIIKAFIGPFFATFFITPSCWCSSSCGSTSTTSSARPRHLHRPANAQLLAATTVPLALPLAVTALFDHDAGHLGETYELVAIKSGAVSLLRFLRPLLFVSFLITLVASTSTQRPAGRQPEG